MIIFCRLHAGLLILGDINVCSFYEMPLKQFLKKAVSQTDKSALFVIIEDYITFMVIFVICILKC